MTTDIKRQKEAIAASHQEDLSQLHQERLDRCIPVAQAILKLIADSTLPLGDKVLKRDASGKVLPIEEDSRPQEYIDAAKQVLQLMLDANICWPERQFIFSLVKQPMDMLQNICMMDTDKTFQDGLNNLFGVKYFGDVTMQQVDTFVKTYAEMVKQLTTETPEAPVAPVVAPAIEAPAPTIDATPSVPASTVPPTPPAPSDNSTGTN